MKAYWRGSLYSLNLILCPHHLDNILIFILLIISENFYSMYKMPHIRALGASEGLFIHPSITNPSMYPSLYLSIHPPIHSPTYPLIYLPTHPSTYSPTFLISLWSGNFSPSQFSSLHVSNNLFTGPFAFSPSHLASLVHISAWPIFLHFSFLIWKIKVNLFLWIVVNRIIIYLSNNGLLSSYFMCQSLL